MLSEKDLKAQLKPVKSFTPMYRLRWSFEFTQKAAKRGIWNGSSSNPKDMAAYVDKTGLKRALIEGEKVGHGIPVTLFECNGQDYVSAQWEAAVVAPMFFPAGVFRCSGDVIGLSFITREQKVSIYIDGSIKKRPLRPEERRFKMEEHSLGV